MTGAGPVLEVDKEGRVASSAFAGAQRVAVAASIGNVAVYYVNVLLDRFGMAPPPHISSDLDLLVLAVVAGALAAVGKMLRNRGVETVF